MTATMIFARCTFRTISKRISAGQDDGHENAQNGLTHTFTEACKLVAY